jgi:putative SOS response-associated peptidase YedK
LDDLTRHIQKRYHIEDIADDIWAPRYNIAPGQKVLAVLNDGQKNRVGLIKWGYLPALGMEKSFGTGIINAKAETLAEKPLFQSAFAHKRCVILADGFYEWKRHPDGKTPIRILMEDESIFALAGIWNTFMGTDGEKVSTCTILTTSANGLVSPIHDRMPVILTAESEKIWMDPKITEGKILEPLLRPFDETLMRAYPVSEFVNSVKNDSEECLRGV